MKKLIKKEYSGIYGYLRNPEIGTGMKPEDRMVEYLKNDKLDLREFLENLTCVTG